jgi:quercetin dioxygenase-like cupin family protein
MDQAKEFHNLDDASDGLFRELGPGVTTRIFSGEQAMLSVVTLAPNAQGTLHHHPEEQWGVLLGRLCCARSGRRGNAGKEGRLLAHTGQRPPHDACWSRRCPRARCV